MAATTTSSDSDTNSINHNASSSSLGDHSHSTGTAAAADAVPEMGPYIRVMRDQLNFFVTRLLFMQEDQADSLGAQTATSRQKMLWNSSNSSGLHSSSGSGLHNSVAQLDASGTNLLGVCVEVSEEEADVLVYQDNARILTNQAAKSMPPLPAIPAAPESPKAVEGRKGLVMVTPHTSSAAAATVLKQNNERLTPNSFAIVTEENDLDTKPAARKTAPPESLPLANLGIADNNDNDDDDDDDMPMTINPGPDNRIFPKNRSRANSKGPRRHSSAKGAIRRSPSSASKASTDDGQGEQQVGSSGTMAKSLH